MVFRPTRSRLVRSTASLKIEDLRVFPISNDGHDIVDVFERLFRNSRVDIRLKTRAKASAVQTAVLRSTSLATSLSARMPSSLTTGGQAYRHAGSTGDGYGFAIGLGHRLGFAASLNAFSRPKHGPPQISLSFERRIWTDRGPRLEATGPFLFTHKGVSGPAVFALSSRRLSETCEQGPAAQPLVDLCPIDPRKTWAPNWTGPSRNMAARRRKRPRLRRLQIPRGDPLPGARHRSRAHAVNSQKADRRRIVSWLKPFRCITVARGAGDNS